MFYLILFASLVSWLVGQLEMQLAHEKLCHNSGLLWVNSNLLRVQF